MNDLTTNSINNETSHATNNDASLGATMERNMLREKMIEAGQKCGYALLHYYTLSESLSQQNKMKYMLKDLLYSEKEEAEFLCETIYEEANTHLTSAMKYGYTANDLGDLRKYTNAYKALLKNKRLEIVNKKGLDDVMESFRKMVRQDNRLIG